MNIGSEKERKEAKVMFLYHHTKGLCGNFKTYTFLLEQDSLYYHLPENHSHISRNLYDVV